MIDKYPLVSVLVPCYNQAHFLPEALDSLLAQTYTNWEAIVVNDGSSDNTEDVALKYVEKDSRIKYIYQDNKGLSGARNTAILHSSGKYLLPLDSDDKIANHYLLNGVDFLERHSDYSVYYGKAEFFGGKLEKWNIEYKNYRELLKRNCIYCSSIFRKEECLACGCYDESFKKGLEDWEFYIRLLRGEKKVFQDSTVVFFYRKNPNGNSMSDRFDETYQNTALTVYAKHINIYIKYFDNPLEYVNGTHWSQRRIGRIAHRIQLEFQKFSDILNKK